jgi:MFS family permease
MNGAMTIIAGASPLEKRPLYIGIMIGISSLGIVMGPLIGGALTEHTTWRWYVSIPAHTVTTSLHR